MKARISVLMVIALASLVSVGYVSNSGKYFNSKGGKVQIQDTTKYEKYWEKADAFLKKGFPRSAAEVVEDIYKKAKHHHNQPQLIKAILYKMRILGDFEENFMVRVISDLKTEIHNTKEPATQILHSVLAEVYHSYYRQNRYKFMNRTPGMTVDEYDLETWDLEKIMLTITMHYEASLANKDKLISIPINEFDLILEKEKNSELYRPTLYDFLAHRAVDFFMSDENTLTQPAYVFRIDDPAYFGNAGEFVNMRIDDRDTLSLKYHALLIMQDLIGFHLEDKDPTALVDVDLKRLRFVNQNIQGVEKQDSLYLSALDHLKEEYSGFPIVTDVIFDMAGVYRMLGDKYDPYSAPQFQWDLKKAVDLCKEAIKMFPKSMGANNCLVLAKQIEEPFVSLTTASVEVPGQPILANLSFRNAISARFRIIKTSSTRDKELQNKYRTVELIRHYNTYASYADFPVKLKNEGDFQRHAAQIKIPELEPGYYIILINSSSAVHSSYLTQAISNLRISRISYLDSKTTQGNYEFYTLDRYSGKALKNVTVRAYKQEYDYKSGRYSEKRLGMYQSDSKGYVNVPLMNARKNFSVEFIHKGDTLKTDEVFYSYPERRDEKARTETYFFTDRSIYRPGQTVYFKGIMFTRTGDKYQIKPAETTTVSFHDVNGREVSSLDLKTNDYGSFHGSFITPTGVLTGMMKIGNKSGAAWFRVEEYKRPKFEVVFNPVKGSYKLNEELTVTGKAMAYAGNSVDHARVKYRVVRNVKMPYWRWRMPIPFRTAEMEITNGFSETDENGEFSVTFKAIPDLSIKKSFEPIFNYTVYADVTDINGETHSSETSVAVGEKALILKTDFGEEVNRDKTEKIKIIATNLNGEKINTSGSIKIFRLDPPARIFRSRLWDRPDVFVMDKDEFIKDFPHDVYDEENNPETWAKAENVIKRDFNTSHDTLISLTDILSWQPGSYLVELESVDEFGKEVLEKEYFDLFASVAKKIPGNAVNWFKLLNKKCEPGQKANFLFGSAAKNIHAVYEIRTKGKTQQRTWLDLSGEQNKYSIPVIEEYRGNLGISIAFVKFNRYYSNVETLVVPYTNKELDIVFETFRNKMEPGSKEEWRLKISGKDGDKVTAEMLASMYDASLDAFVPHQWNLNLFHGSSFSQAWTAGKSLGSKSSRFVHRPHPGVKILSQEYDKLNWFGFNFYHGYRFTVQKREMGMAQPIPGIADGEMEALDEVIVKDDKIGEVQPPKIQTDKTEVKPEVRRDFRETAFFFPDLMTNEQGEVILKFTMPEALTRWKFMGLAYTQDLKVGQTEKEVVTQKELMVVPNAPRFFREGDQMTFSAKITSLSDKDLEGEVGIDFYDALSMQLINDRLQLKNNQESFEVKKGQSTSVGWNIVIPEGLEAITYRITATAGNFSDGEEMAIPVLPNRMLVTESLPLPIRGNETKNFRFDRLIHSSSSKTLKNYKLTLEYTSNPAWYAVQALPYLIEYPYECAEQIFSRYYANSMATYIANSNPKIKQVFDAWRNLSPDALLSNLEKNQDLKAVLLEETPWVRQAKDESERKKRIALLFDLNKMSYELDNAILKLQQMQARSGGWPWFEGMRESRYITQHIVTGLAHLDHLGIQNLRDDKRIWQMIIKALQYLDNEIREDYEMLKKNSDSVEDDHLSNIQIQYLYARSYFMKDFDVPKKNREAFNYFKSQADKYWVEKDVYMQGMIALALNRFGYKSTPSTIIASLKERALHSEEMGMYWRPNNGWFWYQAPIERQALLIEAFDEVSNDLNAVEEMKVWLLKQKQTQDWKTTKATTEAIYALLLRGTDLLSDDELVEITLGGKLVDPKTEEDVQVEAGTGYFRKSWTGNEITPDMGKVEVRNPNNNIAWGALYWQYFENLDEITPHKTPLGIVKELFIEKNTDRGPVIEAVGENAKINIGDKVIVRITIRVDRDMEYIHLKDMRASAFEPVNVLSGYRWQGGLGYYESTRDASVNFFIGYLPKGTYVFEYPLIASQKGDFSNGITTIQCMYAPEFTSHSEGVRVEVK